MGWSADCAVALQQALDELSNQFSVLRHAKLTTNDPAPNWVRVRLERSPWHVYASAVPAEREREAGEWHTTTRKHFPGEPDLARFTRHSATRAARLDLRIPRGREEAVKVWEARFKAALDACLAAPE
jgi:hypothetical protein